jgi:hypothetical protein
MVKRWLGWDQLNTKTLEDGSSAQDINLQSKDVHLQESNKEVLRDVVLVNEAAMRTGRAIPGTGKISVVTVTDNTQTNITPGIKAGEVWVTNIIGGKRTGGSGDVTYQLYYEDGTNEINWFYFKSDDSNILFTGDSNYLHGLHVDENTYISAVATGSGGGTYTNVQFQVSMYRIR